MAYRRNYGRLIEGAYNMKPHYEPSRDMIKRFFEDNASLLMLIGKSANKQREELREVYGIRVGANAMSEMRQGKRYRTGLLLLVAIKCYWLSKGYEIKID